MRVMEGIKEEGRHRTVMVEFDNVEYANPIEAQIKKAVHGLAEIRMAGLRLSLDTDENSPIKSFSEDELYSVCLNIAEKDWQKKYQEIIDTELPTGLLDILTCNSKAEQIRIIGKDMTLTSIMLNKFSFLAYTDYGYLFSMYSFETLPKGVDDSEMPRMAIKRDDNTVEKYGGTSMKDGQIKNAIDHRKRTIAKFFDKGDIWHCFFYDYN